MRVNDPRIPGLGRGRHVAFVGAGRAVHVRPRPAGGGQNPAPRPPPKKAPAARRPTPPPPPIVEPAPPPAPAPPPPTDVKVVTAYTQGAQVSQNTTYIHGPRQRVEFPGMVSLDQCDLQRTRDARARRPSAYRVQAYGQPIAAAPAPDPATAPPSVGGMPMPPGMGAPPAARRGRHGDDDADRYARTPADVRPRGASHQDGGRAPAVGRRLRQDRPLRIEIDTWYVDLPKSGDACTRASAAPAAAPPPATDGCQDRIDTRVAGDVTLGFPVKTTTTTMSGEGEKQETSSTTSEATALEITQLDAAALRGAGRLRRSQELDGTGAVGGRRRHAGRRASSARPPMAPARRRPRRPACCASVCWSR